MVWYLCATVIMPSEKVLPARMNMELITKLQEDNADIFTPKAVYDGRKNLFAAKELKFGRNKTKNGWMSLSMVLIRYGISHGVESSKGSLKMIHDSWAQKGG